MNPSGLTLSLAGEVARNLIKDTKNPYKVWCSDERKLEKAIVEKLTPVKRMKKRDGMWQPPKYEIYVVFKADEYDRLAKAFMVKPPHNYHRNISYIKEYGTLLYIQQHLEEFVIDHLSVKTQEAAHKEKIKEVKRSVRNIIDHHHEMISGKDRYDMTDFNEFPRLIEILTKKPTKKALSVYKHYQWVLEMLTKILSSPDPEQAWNDTRPEAIEKVKGWAPLLINDDPDSAKAVLLNSDIIQ